MKFSNASIYGIKGNVAYIDTLMIAIAKKGVIMEINNNKNHLSHTKASFIMLLFAMCLIMNVFFCGAYNPNESFDETTAIDTRIISNSIPVNEGGDTDTYSKALFLNKDNCYHKTITKNIFPILIAAIPIGISVLLFLITVFLFFCLTLFILLPDGWTLINKKVRLDN
ncbi:hypothetical protein NXH76_14095 [Blautia schinkii]|nr:hypothetical protein [Blautia schinkii]